MNILLILHTYSRDHDFSSFAKELIAGFCNTGANIYVIKANDLVENLSSHRMSGRIDKDKLSTLFKENQFDMIFTTNYGGITSYIRALSKKIPIVSWMVDRNPFMHAGQYKSPFQTQDHVITSSTANVESICTKFKLNKKQVHFFPFMTNPSTFSVKNKNINISFVGSYFLNESIVLNLLKHSVKAGLKDNLLAAITELENNYDTNEYELIKRHKLGLLLLLSGIKVQSFKGAVGNMLSNRKRIEYLGAISDLGLNLYGTQNWAKTLSFSPSLASCFNYNYFVNDRDRLTDIYDRSTISININHHQATTGVGYRVFDILASSSLLLSNFQEKSDLNRLFGYNHPIPIYKNADELREMSKFYLQNNQAREDLILKCNRLIGDDHTFDNRANQIISLVNPTHKPTSTKSSPIIFDKKSFYKDDANEKSNKHSAYLSLSVKLLMKAIRYASKKHD